MAGLVSKKEFSPRNFLFFLITLLVLVESVISFSTQSNPKPSALFSGISAPRSLGVLSVAAESEVGAETVPELGRDGIYHITNPEQHKYVCFN